MRVFLIRHGETVDNVAGLYAGSRDSQLTNHGVEQTKRLGQYFARNDVRFTHIFSSPLSRALKTARAIADAQQKEHGTELEIVKRTELMERDFGSFEGKPFSSRTRDAEDDDDVERKESLAKRIDVFLDGYFLPLLDEDSSEGVRDPVVAVVAHGMLLAHFWRRLLLRIPKNSLTIAPEIAEKRGGVGLEYIGGWSNTGYLELDFKRTDTAKGGAPSTSDGAIKQPADEATLPTPIPPTLEPEDGAVSLKTNEDDPPTKNDRPITISKWYINFMRRLALLGADWCVLGPPASSRSTARFISSASSASEGALAH